MSRWEGIASGRVVVTGCAGFIGSNLCRMLLAEGYDVVGVDDLSAGLREQVPDAVDLAEMNVLDPELPAVIAGAAAVVHLAARNCLSDCLEHPLETVRANVEGTVAILEACRLTGVRRVLHASSSAVYEGVTALPTAEPTVHPIGPYAASKLASEHFVGSYARLHGLEPTTFRYFNVYGPHQDVRRAVVPVMSAFALRLLAGEAPVIFGDGSKRRDFVYVDDVNRFHVACLRDSRSVGGTFNVGTGVNHSVLEIYQAVVSQLGIEIPPTFSPELPGEARETLADISAARALGYLPRFDLNEGLARSIAHLQDATRELR